MGVPVKEALDVGPDVCFPGVGGGGGGVSSGGSGRGHGALSDVKQGPGGRPKNPFGGVLGICVDPLVKKKLRDPNRTLAWSRSPSSSRGRSPWCLAPVHLH